ncbi:MAG: EthD family reductase [Nitrososphaerales archaeon]
MVAKLIVLYNNIEDPEKFDEYYKNTHIPLAKKIPGVRKISVSKVKGVAVGKANYYQVVEVYFDDIEFEEG